MKINVIGAGLAGCEAAWQLANAGIKVTLYEQKPAHYSPAHSLPTMAELVCSNSLRAAGLENAVGLLKEEMRLLGSLIMECADSTKVPAGGALAVDRELFSKMVSDKIYAHPNIAIINEKIEQIPQDEYTIIATGPLTDGKLYENIRSFFGDDDYLHFYDAAAPIVEKDSIDMSKAYYAARYGKGGADYINCPMTKDEYTAFYNALITAETAPVHGADEGSVFEGCMPVETMAKRGEDTLLFGPLKPVGLEHPETKVLPYAVVQLRQDNTAATIYNIVGFQTRLKFGEQKRVFSMIPGLENASFVRYGVMHRNTFINSPLLLDSFYRAKTNPKIFFAGQITGVEGYIESASSGLLAGFNLARQLNNKDMIKFPSTTAMGALAHYISSGSTGKFQPMNINFGIIDSLDKKVKNKKEKNIAISQRAIDVIKNIISERTDCI